MDEKDVTTNVNQNASEPSSGETTDPQQGEETIESLMEQIASIKADNAKLKTDIAKAKSANDKLSSENGTLRKQYRAKLTAEEEAEAQKAEQEAQHEEYVKGLERKLAIRDATDEYLATGMFDLETAKATATARIDGNEDVVRDNEKKARESWMKKTEADIRAKLQAEMPTPQSGNASGVDYKKLQSDALANDDGSSYLAAIMAEARANGFGNK